MKLSVFKRFSSKSKLLELQQKINYLESQIAFSSSFIKELEKGNLDAVHIDAENLKDSKDGQGLTASLVSLRDQLKVYSIEEKERNWVAQGLANFIEILRSKNSNDLSAITDEIIRNLVKYMGANQGALYIINDSNPDDIYLQMEACYAYERKKHKDVQFRLGEGLIGQVVLEKDTIYLSEIPKDYIKITSGLGDSLPRELLFVPLKLEENIYGVIELASFYPIHKYQIDFVERLAESIASTIGNVKVNQQTKQLLEETQLQAEHMRSQEEEVRQNMEELSATQEEMERVLTDVKEKEIYLNNLLNASGDAIMTIGLDLTIVMFNKYLAKTFAAQGITVKSGMSVFELAKSSNHEEDRGTYVKVFNGESVTKREEYFGRHYEMSFQPLKDADGEIKGALMTTRDITKDIELLLEVKKQEQYLNELINVPQDSIFTLDRNYRILSYNKAMADGLQAFGITELKGFSLLDLFPEEAEKKKQIAIYERAFNGESFDVLADHTNHDKISYYSSNYAPLRNAEGSIIAIASFTKDVTQLIASQKQTEKLLNASQQATEELRAQEEEMRQNMEELAAIQEDMERVLKASRDKEQYLNELINVPQDSIFTLDRQYNILSYNKAFAKGLEALGISDLTGFNLLNLFPEEAEKKKQKAIMERAFKGENFEIVVDHTSNGITNYYSSNYAPLRDSAGKIVAIASFSKDVTAIMNQKKK